MRLNVFVLSVLMLHCATSALALDPVDQGVFGFVHRDGHLTDSRMRTRLENGRWHVEDKRPDGTWADVSCEDGCVLQESTREEAKRFFSAEDLQRFFPMCVHNKAFAFCRVMRIANPADWRYVLVALTESQPIIIHLKRVEASGGTAGKN